MTNQEYENFKQFIEKTLYDTMSSDDYFDVLDSLDIPYKGNRIKGACHHDLDELENASYSVYFDEEGMFLYCHVCCESYNLLSYVDKAFEMRRDKRNRVQCMKYICDVCEIPFDFSCVEKESKDVYNWKHLKKYTGDKNEVELKEYSEDILNVFSRKYHTDWLDYGISIETLEKYKIMWYDYKSQIAIPCYDKDNILRGIRVRNMAVDDNFDIPKYDIFRSLNGDKYNFPTNTTFYGENHNFDEIKRTKTVWLVESEKSVLKFDTWFGDKNVSLGLFGSSLGDIRKLKLLELEVNTVIIMLDSDFYEMYDEDFDKFEKKVFKIVDMLSPYVDHIDVVYNNQGYDGYKYAPCDFTRAQFEVLMDNRERIK